jgi:hypothetical protein
VLFLLLFDLKPSFAGCYSRSSRTTGNKNGIFSWLVLFSSSISPASMCPSPTACRPITCNCDASFRKAADSLRITIDEVSCGPTGDAAAVFLALDDLLWNVFISLGLSTKSALFFSSPRPIHIRTTYCLLHGNRNDIERIPRRRYVGNIHGIASVATIIISPILECILNVRIIKMHG